MKVAARHPNAMPKLTVRYRTLVFGAAVHAGNIDVFHFFQLLYMKLVNTLDKVSDTIKESLLVVRRMYNVVCIS